MVGQGLTHLGLDTAEFWAEVVDPDQSEADQVHAFAVAGGEVIANAVAGLLRIAAGVPASVSVPAIVERETTRKPPGALGPWAASRRDAEADEAPLAA